MGIRDLFTFLQKRNVQYEHQTVHYFSNSRIAIDAYSLFFRLFYSSKNIGLISHEEIAVGLLNAFLDRWPKTTKLIFIFDSPIKSELKLETLQKRRSAEQVIQNEIEQLEQKVSESPFNPLLLQRKEMLQRRSKKTFPSVCKEMRNVLKKREIEVIIAKDEAEHYACEMAIKGTADYVYSKDSDCIALGCPALIFDEEGGSMKMYRLSTILKTLNLTINQLRDFAILLGTDYNSRYMSPEEAYQNIRRYETMENIPEINATVIESLRKIREQYTIL